MARAREGKRNRVQNRDAAIPEPNGAGLQNGDVEAPLGRSHNDL
jgi:hypothetical protein